MILSEKIAMVEFHSLHTVWRWEWIPVFACHSVDPVPFHDLSRSQVQHQVTNARTTQYSESEFY